MARAKAAKPPAARQAASGRGGIVAFGVVASAIVAAAVLAFWPQAATAPEPQRKRTPASLKPQPRPQAVGGEYVDAFALRALPTLRRFIFSHYADFASSQLTFRDLKVCCGLSPPYPTLPHPTPPYPTLPHRFCPSHSALPFFVALPSFFCSHAQASSAAAHFQAPLRVTCDSRGRSIWPRSSECRTRRSRGMSSQRSLRTRWTGSRIRAKRVRWQGTSALKSSCSPKSNTRHQDNST